MKKSFLVPLLLFTSLSGAAMADQAVTFHLNVPNGSGANPVYFDKTYSVSVYTNSNSYRVFSGVAHEDENGILTSTFGPLGPFETQRLYFKVDVSAGRPGAFLLKDGDNLQGDYCKVSAVEAPAAGATEFHFTFNPLEAPNDWVKCG